MTPSINNVKDIKQNVYLMRGTDRPRQVKLIVIGCNMTISVTMNQINDGQVFHYITHHANQTPLG